MYGSLQEMQLINRLWLEVLYTSVTHEILNIGFESNKFLALKGSIFRIIQSKIILRDIK